MNKGNNDVPFTSCPENENGATRSAMNPQEARDQALLFRYHSDTYIYIAKFPKDTFQTSAVSTLMYKCCLLFETQRLSDKGNSRSALGTW